MLATAVCTPYLLSLLSSMQNVIFKVSKGFPNLFVVILVSHKFK